MHPIYTNILRKSLQMTGRPAVAAQVFITMVSLSAYYDFLPTFDISANASMSTWVKVSMPVRWTGFIVVTTVIAMHTVLVAGILVAFVRYTKYSKLTDPWSIFVHASSGELAGIIEDTKQLDAKDRAEIIKEQEMENGLVGLGLDDSNKIVGVRRRTQAAQETELEEPE
ncbi:hypothetical protein F5Y11DRAFT_367803 [Daldinia sp. FL1419]|nr:hypothetical protein F5Y11DRAFT_367803 [Daldinia sp. FL1419]